MPTDSDLFTDDRPRAGDKQTQPSRAPAGLEFHEVQLNDGADASHGPLLGSNFETSVGDNELFPSAAAVTPDGSFTNAEEVVYTEGADGTSVDVVIYKAGTGTKADQTTGAPVMAITNDAASPLALTGLAASTKYIGFIRGKKAGAPASAFRRFEFTTNAA
jgi:hypothetical protein